jgi:hypothetical protein
MLSRLPDDRLAPGCYDYQITFIPVPESEKNILNNTDETAEACLDPVPDPWEKKPDSSLLKDIKDILNTAHGPRSEELRSDHPDDENIPCEPGKDVLGIINDRMIKILLRQDKQTQVTLQIINDLSELKRVLIDKPKDIIIGEYQLCPKCKGEKKIKMSNVQSAPGIASDGLYNCDICDGNGIIKKPMIKI